MSHITVSLQACLWASILWVVKPATPGISLVTCVRVVMFLHLQDQLTEYIITGVLRGDSCGDVLVSEVRGSTQAFYSLHADLVHLLPTTMSAHEENHATALNPPKIVNYFPNWTARALEDVLDKIWEAVAKVLSSSDRVVAQQLSLLHS